MAKIEESSFRSVFLLNFLVFDDAKEGEYVAVNLFCTWHGIFLMPFSNGHFLCAFLHWIRSKGKKARIFGSPCVPTATDSIPKVARSSAIFVIGRLVVVIEKGDQF